MHTGCKEPCAAELPERVPSLEPNSCSNYNFTGRGTWDFITGKVSQNWNFTRSLFSTRHSFGRSHWEIIPPNGRWAWPQTTGFKINKYIHKSALLARWTAMLKHNADANFGVDIVDGWLDRSALLEAGNSEQWHHLVHLLHRYTAVTNHGASCTA